jgi:hypothetical protein
LIYWQKREAWGEKSSTMRKRKTEETVSIASNSIFEGLVPQAAFQTLRTYFQMVGRLFSVGEENAPNHC